MFGILRLFGHHLVRMALLDNVDTRKNIDIIKTILNEYIQVKFIKAFTTGTGKVLTENVSLKQ